MKSQTITVLKRKARPETGISREYPIVERKGKLIGFTYHNGETGYLNQRIFGEVTKKRGKYYVIVRGTLEDANHAIDEFLEHPVDKYAGKPFNPLVKVVKMLLPSGPSVFFNQLFKKSK